MSKRHGGSRPPVRPDDKRLLKEPGETVIFKIRVRSEVEREQIKDLRPRQRALRMLESETITDTKILFGKRHGNNIWIVVAETDNATEIALGSISYESQANINPYTKSLADQACHDMVGRKITPTGIYFEFDEFTPPPHTTPARYQLGEIENIPSLISDLRYQ